MNLHFAQFSAKNRHYAIICDVIDETCGVFYRSYNKISKNNELNWKIMNLMTMINNSCVVGIKVVNLCF